jgi:N-dimethylarginine dimethylaminohydrolase
MITRERSVERRVERRASVREYLMCPPEHFAVTYAINPWMAPETPTDAALAMRHLDMSELLKGGGGPKCCTLELRP